MVNLSIEAGMHNALYIGQNSNILMECSTQTRGRVTEEK